MNSFDIDKIKESLKNSKSLSESLKKLGKKVNGGNIRTLKKIIIINSIDFPKKNINKQKYCLVCGKELEKQQKKFCSSSCAAKYNNKGRKVSEETRNKISKSLLKTNKKETINEQKYCLVCGKELKGRQKLYCSQKCKRKMYSHTKYHTEYSKKKDENGSLKKYEYIMKLGGKCCMCGYDKNFSALTFHHLRDKKFTLDARTFERCPKDLLEEEIKKCIVVCFNCHQEIHHPQHNKGNYNLTTKKLVKT